MKREALETALRERLSEIGYELVALQWAPEAGGRTLRVLIDHKHGISLEDCAVVSRALSETLDVQDWGLGSYRLEVSSPGIERPLTRIEDYKRFVGKKVAIKTKEPISGRRNYRGRLAKVVDEHIIVESDGLSHDVLLENIKKAHLIYEKNHER